MATKSAKRRNNTQINTISNGVLSDEERISNEKKAIRSILNRDIKVIAKNNSQKDLIKSILSKEILICSGPAGTGKTFISLGLALGLLRAENNKFTKIYLVKSVTTLKGEEIGYLKGDLKEKIEPFIWSFVLNVEKLIPDVLIRSIVDSDYVRPFPLAYARGVSIDNAIIIADEVQNISIDNMHTLMTRIGENSKMILLGDTKQVDLKNKDESSLNQLINMFENVDKIGIVEMSSHEENVRNPIINIIEEKFEELENHKPRRGRPKKIL